MNKKTKIYDLHNIFNNNEVVKIVVKHLMKETGVTHNKIYAILKQADDECSSLSLSINGAKDNREEMRLRESRKRKGSVVQISKISKSVSIYGQDVPAK